MMDTKLLLEIITLVISVGAIVFTAGGFYVYVPRELARLREDLARVEATAEEKGRDRRDQLEEKVDKNFETLAATIKEKDEKLRGDLSGIGGKVSRNHEGVMETFRRNERDAYRRHSNTTTAIMLVAPIAKEKEVSELLKEEAS